ncbi:TPA: MucBP domain-containing protein [Streptococcus suis]|nr:MucBP domain-containing protein [Streptococcus suis]HEM3476084.1 MucBP domain-containing protein [Streptococcus suis]HEM3482547.1 MucBP domain-containing protein [Streptococcus suis]
MRKAKKKSFNWYGMKQHFSIRKYHFGAASVLLGMSLVMGAGAQTVKAEETAASSDATTASSISVDSLNADAKESVALPTETAASSERTVDISYVVKYVLEDGSVVSASVESVSTTTTEAIAKATATVTAVVPEGYELASGESATVLHEVTENAENIVTVKVVQKVEATATVSTPTTTSTTVATASSTTTASTSTTPTTPATVEEAKTVLEQVTSEAEVLANEANRFVAADSTNEALKTAAAATKLVVTEATVVLNDSTATLESVNAQINAVRSNVEALALELRKFYPNGEIIALLNTTTSSTGATTIDASNSNSIYYAQKGVWYIPDLVKAANAGLPVADQEATITEGNKNIPAGYIGDQDANRDTFLIIELDAKAGDGLGFNEWVGKNYYITFSVSTDATERAANDVVYAKLVEKTDSGNTVVNTIELKPGVQNNFDELKVLEGDATHPVTYGFTYKVSTANGGTTRSIAMENSNGNNRNVIKYSKLEPSRVDAPFNATSFLVTGSTTQTTSYFVKENAATGRVRELLAKYTQTGGLIGDAFHIAGPIDFDNYELIASELPTVTSGTLASDYVVGSQWISYGANYNEARLYTITDVDGSLQIQVYMLDPNNPDWAKFYKTNQNNATVSDIPEYFKLMFTTEVLAPQTYNSKQGTATLKFYEANKLVLESTEIQVLDANGDVLGTLSDDKTTITTTAGAKISVASTTDTMVTGADGTIYTVNYNKIYKTDAAGNYVDADGNVLTPILWDKATPNNPYVKNIYGPSESGVDNVTISTGPLEVNQHPDGVWYFGYNYKTAASETRLTDSETDKRWDLGGQELTLRNANMKNEQHARYWYIEKGGVEVYYITDDGTVLKNFTANDGSTVADKNVVVDHGDTDSAYDTSSVRYSSIKAADGTVYLYKEIDTTTANLHPVVNDTTDTDYRANEKIDAETGTIKTDTVKQLTYVYEKAGNVIVHYVDENGNPISGTTDAGTETDSTVTDTDYSVGGTAYDTTDLKPKTITTADGKIYQLVPAATQGNETGKVVAGETQEITYVYKLVEGDVIVHYVDTDGNKIADDVTDQVITDTGTAYDTTDNKPEKIVNDTTGDVYYYKEVKAGDKETGKVVEGTTEVTYIYEKAGSVNVNYVDTDGNVIKTKVADETDVKPGTAYDTVVDNKPETIATADGKLYRLVPAGTYNVGTVSDSSNLTAAGNGTATGVDAVTGTVEAGKTKEITYVYEEVKGDVVVEYYDTEGNVIATTVVDTPTTSTGTPYSTLDQKPSTITTADGTVYYYKEVKSTSAAEEGSVVEGTTTVQYVYEKAGSVNVNYVDTDGNVISPKVADETNEKDGTEYSTTDNKPSTITTTDGKTYKLVPAGTYNVGTVGEGNNLTAAGNGTATGVDSETGTVEAGTTKEITYVYQEVKGSVVVNYVTTDGTVLQAPVTDTPETSTGTPYDTTDVKPETITTADGKTYKLVPALTKGSETGDVVPGVTEVTYVYEEVKGDVVVNYVNTDGKVIATPVVDTKATSTGTAYDTTDNKPEKIIEDATGDVYYYKEVQTGSNETGKVVEGTTEVTYVYEKAGNVVVNYITEDGTVIKTPVNDETNAKPGSPYDTTDNKPKTITTEDGTTYELVRTDGNENGSVEGGKTTEVTYVYRKVEAPVAKTGNVVVEYYNTDGEKIAADVEDTPETAVGTVYETLDYKPTTITKDGVKYYYKEVKATSATEKGTVSEGTTTVQYVYEPGGSVTVNYVTTDGTVIKSPVKDEENAEPGKSYTTEDNKPTTITTEDGKTYKLVPNATTGDENGTITSGEDKQVTYVYEEVKGNVVVNYIDTEGNVIKTPVEDTKSVSTGTAYDTADNKPTTITTEDGTEYKLVPVLTKGEETGKVVEGTTQVTYVYQKVTTPAPKPNGSVVVNYVNTNGETIATSVNDTTDAKLDTPYDTTDYKPAIIKHDGVTYYYKEVKSGDSETGNVVEGTTEVTYIYEPGGSVTVNYVTTDGTVIKSPVKDEENAEPGKSYTTEDNKPTTITTEDGKTYKLVPNATTGDENGTITSGEDKQVTYVYEEVKGNVVVNYIDTEGNVIKTPVEDTKSASTGTAYDTTDNKPTTITTEDGTVYEIVPVLTIGSESGSVVEGTTQVTYVYRKVSTPTPAVKNGTVVVNYVTEDGTVIKSPVTDTPTSPEGTSYDTTDNKPTEITTEDGSRYVLIPSKTIGSENGTVVEGETVVTYVYKKVANWIPEIPSTPENPTPVNPVIPYPFDPTNPDKPVDPTTPGTNGEVPNIPYVPGYTPVDPKDNTPLKPVDPNDPGKGYVPPTPDETGKDTPIPYVQNGNVVVNYVTEDGTVIKSPVNDETDAPAGKSYDTTDNKPTTITTEDGTTYELVRVDGSENGTVVGGKTTEVTYVYRKVETPTKKVVTNHVDEEGNPIAPQEEGTTPDKSIPGYEFTGKTITDEDGNTTHIYKKTPTKTVITKHVDEEGNPVAPQEDGTTPNKSIPGYEYVRTVVDVEGNTTHIYRKVSNKPTPPATETPVKPQPATPTPTADKAKQLPNTGEASSSAGVLGAAMLVAAIALAGKRRRNED